MSIGFQKFDDLDVPENMIHCKKCDGLIMLKTSKFCGNCGRKLEWKLFEDQKEKWVVKI